MSMVMLRNESTDFATRPPTVRICSTFEMPTSSCSREFFRSKCCIDCANAFVSAPINFREQSRIEVICWRSIELSVAPRSLHCSMERSRIVNRESVVDNDAAEAKTSCNVTLSSCIGRDPEGSVILFGQNCSPRRTIPCNEGRHLAIIPISVGLMTMAPEASQTPRDDSGDQESSRRITHRAIEGELWMNERKRWKRRVPPRLRTESSQKSCFLE